MHLESGCNCYRPYKEVISRTRKANLVYWENLGRERPKFTANDRLQISTKFREHFITKYSLIFLSNMQYFEKLY